MKPPIFNVCTKDIFLKKYLRIKSSSVSLCLSLSHTQMEVDLSVEYLINAGLPVHIHFCVYFQMFYILFYIFYKCENKLSHCELTKR